MFMYKNILKYSIMFLSVLLSPPVINGPQWAAYISQTRMLVGPATSVYQQLSITFHFHH